MLSGMELGLNISAERGNFVVGGLKKPHLGYVDIAEVDMDDDEIAVYRRGEVVPILQKLESETSSHATFEVA
jgi:hypothetical protein